MYEYKENQGWSKNHLIDSTALLAESTPVFAAFETGLFGAAEHIGLDRVSDEVSLNARLIAAGITYFGGMGYAYARGRDLSRRLFKVTETSRERVQGFHDAIYLGIFNLAVAPLIYVASGARDIKEIAFGTTVAIGLGLTNGAPLGFAVDMGRDLMGLKECNRSLYPQLLKRRSSKIKKGLAALLTAGAIALTAGVYKMTPNNNNHSYQQPTPITQTIEDNLK